jgi:hypothetical protein
VRGARKPGMGGVSASVHNGAPAACVFVSPAGPGQTVRLLDSVEAASCNYFNTGRSDPLSASAVASAQCVMRNVLGLSNISLDQAALFRRP